MMMNAEQADCVKMVVSRMPKVVKDSPIILDVVDESMRHIMGGDPLESLFVKSIRALVKESAIGANEEDWKKCLENVRIQSFGNCFLNKSAEIMLPILENCNWSGNEAALVIKRGQIHLEIDSKTYLQTSEPITVPNWFAIVMRTLCVKNLRSIDLRFEGAPYELDHFEKMKKELFLTVQTTDFSSKPLVMARCRYPSTHGTVSFAAHSKRKGGFTLFSKFVRAPIGPERDINEVLKRDII